MVGARPAPTTAKIGTSTNAVRFSWGVMKKIALILAVAAVAIGCRGQDDRPQASRRRDPISPFVGKWADKPKDAKVALEVKPDRNFVATFVIGSKLTVVKGSAAASEIGLSLTPNTVNGRVPKGPGESSAESMILSADGLSLSTKSGPTLFKRTEEVAKND